MVLLIRDVTDHGMLVTGAGDQMNGDAGEGLRHGWRDTEDGKARGNWRMLTELAEAKSRKTDPSSRGGRLGLAPRGVVALARREAKWEDSELSGKRILSNSLWDRLSLASFPPCVTGHSPPPFRGTIRTTPAIVDFDLHPSAGEIQVAPARFPETKVRQARTNFLKSHKPL